MINLNDNYSRIQLGDYIILQRQKYTKLVKFSNIDSNAMLGKEQLELRNILGHPYFSTFKMCAKEDLGKTHRGRQRLYTLELCTEIDDIRDIREALGISSSGIDNRNIIDRGNSQALKPDDIEQLRDEYNNSSKIIEKIVENSKTFHERTEYSQEKYLRKKEKKYFEFLQIRRPSIRLLAEIYYRQDADKILGIRMDTLSQMISYSGVSGYGCYLMYESGTNGLLPAAFLNSIGANTEAQLVHMHPGNICQKQALLALDFPAEQLERCVSVNIYSVLREYYQNNFNNTKLKEGLDEHLEPEHKKQKLEDQQQQLKIDSTKEHFSDKTLLNVELTGTYIINDEEIHGRQKWRLENRKACQLLHEKCDSLLIAAKEHPSNIVKELLQFLKPSRPFVIYNTCREILTDLYIDLKSTASNVVNLHLTSNWMRMYQIMPNRTHPEVNMYSNSGYLLIGYTVQEK